FPECSDYDLELPEVLAAGRVHTQFYASLLRPYVESIDVLFPNLDRPGPHDF
ncbi:hypothetical protein B0H11DRAFT_1663110, partial [Mycena galericulata]